MSCTECQSYSGTCPCCEEEVKMEQCEECGGVGYILYDGCGDAVPEVYHKEDSVKVCTLLGEGKCECTITRFDCETCNGIGEVPIQEYEPDPDEKWDSRFD